MSENINIKIENNKEVKQIKKKYKKLKDILLIIIFIILVLLIINFIHDFIIFEKVVKNNAFVYLGENYKITSEDNGQERIIYYKDGVRKGITRNKNNEVVSFNDIAYLIMHDEKQYYTNDEMMLLHGSNDGKENLFMYMGWSEESLDKIDILKTMITSFVRVGKEEYKGKQYITVQMNMYKIWVNPDTYYIEKENLDGQIGEKTIEKNVVTDEDMQVPDLTEYKEIEVGQN